MLVGKKMQWLQIVAVQAVCLVVAICLVSAATAQYAPRTSQLVIAQLGNPAALDGWNWTATSEQDILAHMQESLMQYDREAKLQPLLAESLTMRSPTEWIMQIRKGVKFHEAPLGELTAEDVKTSIETNLRKGTSHAVRMPAVMREGTVEVLDPYTIRWRLRDPGLVALGPWLTDMYITSRQHLARVGVDAAVWFKGCTD